MQKRNLVKKKISRFLSLGLCLSLLFTSAGSNNQLVYAATAAQTTAGDSAETDTEDGAALIADADTEGMYYNANSTMRDFRDETIYFVMTTRFYDGDSSNNVQCWDAQALNENDPPWRGDFKGLIEKLDYIKALGFTAIWITPVVENTSGYDYHGYHASDFSKVDSRYESEDCTYQDLIDAAHAKGMKIIQDVVFNHTGNFGEANLVPMFEKVGDQSTIDCLQIREDSDLPDNYYDLPGTQQYAARLALMKNTDGVNHDTLNLYHHYANFGWDEFNSQLAQIAGDCVDLNTENPLVYNYLIDCYTNYINMGVDAFRVDTTKHISRLTFNETFNPAFKEAGGEDFYMFGEVCARYTDVWYRNTPALSTPFYTWAETKDYGWSDDVKDVGETIGDGGKNENLVGNVALTQEHYNDNGPGTEALQPTTDNAFLNGNEYHTPDHSQASGLNVIDFPMHWNFKEAQIAFNVAKGGDKYYNDATWNVVYVDSHDYAPDHAPEDERFNGTQAQWAENLSLMFTFRGIPCIYYGSEVEFQKGKPIDKGPTIALADSGRAYFGDCIEGSVEVTDFGRYTNATGAIADTLNYPLSLHIQRLNRLRAAIPALRKGQYSTEGCAGKMAFKRRYTDSETDSFALVTLTTDATFTGIPNGTYTDAITGDVKNVTNGTLSTSGVKGQGDLRVYVLDSELTKAPGMIDGYSSYMCGGKELEVTVVDATGITLDKTTANLDLGDSVKFTATITPSNVTSKNPTWTSSNTSVAVVNDSGKVTAKGEGTAIITATTRNGLTADATVTVKAAGVKVDSLTLNKDAVTLEAGKTVQISTTIAPSNADPKYTPVTWKSSDSKVARVSSSGLITAVAKGTATITATTFSGVSASIEVDVVRPNIYGNAIYFEKPEEWGSSMKVYLWGTLEDGTAWSNGGFPGVSMKEVDNGVYGIEWPEGKEDVALNVIFSDGSNQTSDLVAKINGYFNKDGYVKEVEVITPPDDNCAHDGATIVKNKVEPTCIAEGYTGDTYCSNCNKKMGAGETIAKTDHTWDKGSVTKEPTATEKGIKTYTCSICSETKTEEIPATGEITDCDHKGTTEIRNAVEATCTAEGYTGDTYCTKCNTTVASGEVIPATGHTLDDGQVTKEPTATEAGVKTYNCTKCTYTKTEVIPPLGETPACTHEGTTVLKDAVEATCTEAGYTGNIFCTKCETVIEQGESIPATGHTLDEGKITKEPTATEVGVKTYSCTKCSYTETEELPKIEDPTCTHEGTTEVQNKTEATCATEGYTGDTVCTKCHTVLARGTTVPKTEDHIWDGGQITKEPSTTETGVKSYTCTRCGKTKTEELPKVEDPTCTHEGTTEIQNRVEATCIANGYTGDTYCTNCKAVVSTGTVILRTGHKWNDGQVTKEPTATTEGTKTYTCTDCGQTKEEVITATGEKPECKHETTIVTGKIDASCTTEGYSGNKYCTECGELVEQGKKSPQTGHTWDAGVITKQPTVTTEGIKKYTCTNCSEFKFETIPAILENPVCTHEGTTILQNQTAATCVAAGYTGDKYCFKCNTVLEKGTEIPQTEHSWNSGVIATPATATENGLMVYTCRNCSATMQEIIPATGESDDTEEDTDDEEDVEEVEVGDVMDDDAGSATYTVTSVTSNTVTYEESNKNAATVKIPDTVRIGGKTYKVTAIASSAFKGDKTVKSITIGSNVKTIGSNAFKNCTNLTKVVIGKNVTKIGASAFYGCTKLKTIALPSKVTSIGTKAFYKCISLTSAVLSTNLTTIGASAFYKCTKLTNITIPSKVSSIGSKAFYGCKKLKTITIKTSKLASSKIGSSAFKGIYAKATIKVPKSKVSAYKTLLQKKGVSKKATIKSLS